MTKIIKDMKFDDILNNRVDMERVNLESIKPWIIRRINGLIKEEDDVLLEYIFNQLEPKYPDPKEIQSNLSGFLSLANSRIFISELWKELMNSMESNVNSVEDGKRIISDKIRSFPRLGPSEIKLSNNNHNTEKKSSQKKEIRQYRLTRSRSESYSSPFNSRMRSRSSSKYKYRSDHQYRHNSRSRTKSSSRYTPYTRYSRYTDSYEKRSSTYRSHLNHYKHKNLSYSPFSSSVSSESTQSDSMKSSQSNSIRSSKSDNVKPRQEIKVLSSVTSNSPSVEIITALSSINNEHIEQEYELNFYQDSLEMHYSSSKVSSIDTSINMWDNQLSVKCTSSSSDSISFVSPNNAQLRRMSSMSDSSSSEYSIEYMDKSLVLQSQKYTSEDDYESEVEWITNEEYQRLQKPLSVSIDSLSSSSSNSFSSSDYSFNDIEWVEQHQLDRLSDDYFRI